MSCTLTGYYRINIFCFHDSVFIVIMNNRFVCHYKTGSHLHSLCSEHKRSSNTASVSNSTCSNYRNIYRIHNLWN